MENETVKDLLMEFFRVNNINAVRGCSGMIHLLVEQMYNSEKNPGKKKFIDTMSESWDRYDKIQKQVRNI